MPFIFVQAKNIIMNVLGFVKNQYLRNSFREVVLKQQSETVSVYIRHSFILDFCYKCVRLSKSNH